MTQNLLSRKKDVACKTHKDVQLSVYSSIQSVEGAVWDTAAQGAGLYLQRPYLLALEEAMSESMEFRYVIYFCEQANPIGVAYFQAVDLRDNGSKYRDGVKKLGPVVGNRIVNEMKIRTLVCGNVFHCGDHGFHFGDHLSYEDAMTKVESTMQRFKKSNALNSKVSIFLFKEFWPEQFAASDRLLDKRYHRFPMDVNMTMEIAPHWDSTEDYLKDLVSKSRTRFKSILKKSNAIEVRSMHAVELEAESARLEDLFKGVLEQSPFIFGRLEMPIYAKWKKELGDDLMFHGFFLEDKLVGFNSAFVLGDSLDVHYVGIDYDYNREYMIYQRMLIDLLQFGIDKGLKRIKFGRTAELAKSALGAVPVHMMLYVKHRNIIANRLIRPLMRSVEVSEFELRSPFKQQT